MKSWEIDFLTEFPFFFDFKAHEVPLRIRFRNPKLSTELKDFFPSPWQGKADSAIVVDWISPSSILSPWDQISDPMCYFDKDFISQRDFLARQVSSKHFQLMADEKIDDGLFNFLRYLLPIELIERNKILYHSSAVVDEKDQAFVFFGPSGAGKSTIADLSGQAGARVLGDDMNILSFSGKRLMVEAGALGQRLYSKEYFGQTFPVTRLFWLEKAEAFGVEEIQSGRLSLLFSSFANLFWDQLDPSNYSKVFNILGRVAKNQRVFRLKFKKDREVWDYVRSIQ